MRRYRGFSVFLLALSILISLNVAYLYHAYYEDSITANVMKYCVSATAKVK